MAKSAAADAAMSFISSNSLAGTFWAGKMIRLSWGEDLMISANSVALVAAFGLAGCIAALGADSPVAVEAIPGQADLGTVEIHGVAAGAFALVAWRAATLNLVPDIRSPLLAPQQGGTFRNIYDTADMNGMNVLLHEDDKYRLYFGDFKARQHVYRASSDDGRRFTCDGTCLDAALAVNDVRKFVVDGRPVYLMGLHANTGRLWYALSDDGMKFEPQRELAASLGDADRYIVAVGWVSSGDRLLGFVYGAGAVPSLDRNRLFARWLQKKLVFTDRQGKPHTATGSLGPDRQVFRLPSGQIEGRFEVFAEDGKTPLGGPIDVKLVPGHVCRLKWGSGPR